MMYPYLTLADGTEVVHSELLEGERGGRVLVHFERPSADGFDSVRFELPSYQMERGRSPRKNSLLCALSSRPMPISSIATPRAEG